MVFHWMVFHRSLCDSKCPQVFRTLLSILTILNNVVVFMVSTHQPTSKSSIPFSNPFVTVQKAPITTGIIVTCMFHSFFQFSCKVEVLILLFTFFSVLFCGQPEQKSWPLSEFSFLFFFFIIIRSGFLAEIRWSICTSKSHRSLCVSSSRTGAGLCIHHLLVWSNCTSPCPPSRVSFYTLSVLICYIRILWDWWFNLYHRIAYISYFVASYLFSFWYDWFLWRCFVLLFGEILFLSRVQVFWCEYCLFIV